MRHAKKQKSVTHSQKNEESIENGFRDQSVMKSSIIIVLYPVFHIKFY